MPFRFLITNALPVEGSPDAESVSEKLQKKGFLFTEDQIAEDYRWKDMPWGWGLRTSIVRIVHFKLLGTGFAAFLTATSPNTGSFTAYSCALCAAVNFFAETVGQDGSNTAEPWLRYKASQQTASRRRRTSPSATASRWRTRARLSFARCKRRHGGRRRKTSFLRQTLSRILSKSG